MEDSLIEQMIMTNYLGSVNVTKAAIPYLKETKGCILLFTSSSYTRGRAMYSIYSSSKAAIVNFAQAMSEELYDDEIRINVINPERTDTPMRRRNFGVEPHESLLESRVVAEETLKTVISDITGQVVDVRRK
jgi:2-C-methyl-D-erythritol 4-phosphate cytidylyltransferase